MKPAKRKEATPLFIATNRGLMKCNLPEFEPSSYVGLKRGIGKTRRSSLHHPANADLLKKQPGSQRFFNPSEATTT
jgi:hypothetical protein